MGDVGGGCGGVGTRARESEDHPSPLSRTVIGLINSHPAVLVWDTALQPGAWNGEMHRAADELDAILSEGGDLESATADPFITVRTNHLRQELRGGINAATMLVRDRKLISALAHPDLASDRARYVPREDGSILMHRRLDGDTAVEGLLAERGLTLDDHSLVLTTHTYRPSSAGGGHLAAATAVMIDPATSHDPGTDRSGSGVVVMVPAHNEARDILDTIRSLRRQTVRPERIVVVSDNSTDPTPALVAELEAEEVELIRTVNNAAKKSGALNAAFRHISGQDGRLPEADTRFILTMDADTDLEPHFLERSIGIMDARPDIGGLSAACHGKPGLGDNWWQKSVIWFQKVEYGRYTYTRLRSNIHTMSGAGSLYRVEALQQLIDERGHVFDERPSNLVEDYETTLALKDHGWVCTANQHCVAYTDLMPTIRELVRQRQRWVRGTIDELRRRGRPDSHTRVSIFQFIFGVLALPWVYGWLGFSIHNAITTGYIDPLWLLLGGLTGVWQAWSIRWMGPRSMLAAALLLPELLFGLVRGYWFFTAIARSFLTNTQDW